MRGAKSSALFLTEVNRNPACPCLVAEIEGAEAPSHGPICIWFSSQGTIQSKKEEISMKVLRISCIFGGLLSLALSLSAQTFTTLHNFEGPDGYNPVRGLLQATYWLTGNTLHVDGGENIVG